MNNRIEIAADRIQRALTTLHAKGLRPVRFWELSQEIARSCPPETESMFPYETYPAALRRLKDAGVVIETGRQITHPASLETRIELQYELAPPPEVNT